jgi:hypothetical protein
MHVYVPWYLSCWLLWPLSCPSAKSVKEKQSFYIFWYSPFKEFGGTFLSRFEGSETDSEVLKSLTIVDTPGILGKYDKTRFSYCAHLSVKKYNMKIPHFLRYCRHKIIYIQDSAEVVRWLNKENGRLKKGMVVCLSLLALWVRIQTSIKNRQ